MRSCFVGIVGNIHFAVGCLAFDVARHPGVVAAASLKMAHGVLDITHSLIRCLMYNWCFVGDVDVNFRLASAAMLRESGEQALSLMGFFTATRRVKAVKMP